MRIRVTRTLDLCLPLYLNTFTSHYLTQPLSPLRGPSGCLVFGVWYLICFADFQAAHLFTMFSSSGVNSQPEGKLRSFLPSLDRVTLLPYIVMFTVLTLENNGYNTSPTSHIIILEIYI